MILTVAAAVLGCIGLALVAMVAPRAMRWAARRREAAPTYVVVPARGRCAVLDARVLVAAWRLRGLLVVPRGSRIEVRTVDGARAELALGPTRMVGDAPFVLRSRSPELVHALVMLASAELGPLVCAIEGCVHGFDVGKSTSLAATSAARSATAAAATGAGAAAASASASRATVRLPLGRAAAADASLARAAAPTLVKLP